MAASPSLRRLSSFTLALAFSLPFAAARAQTGVDDDRVSLPEGPGSLEGVGDDVEFDPNMGSMTYGVEIKLPAGFAGASPALSLDYSSAAGSGPVGIGWSMSVPAIGRMTSRGAPGYDTDDLFDVGGAELVQVGTDGGDLIYRARFESGFVRYRWVDAGTGAEGYWVAENPDGSRSYFGARADGTPAPSARRARPQGGTAEYCLVETVDPYGHSVRYTYDALDGTVPLLTGISWLDDGSGADLYSVVVGYESRPDLLSDAGRGYEELTANRLQSVQVLNGASPIREYVLTYEDDALAGGFSRLARVERYGVGGRAAGRRYPIVFDFAYSQALGVECTGADCDRPYLVDMGNLSGGLDIASGRATLVDINADGLPDVLDTTDSNGHQFQINTLTPNASGGFDHAFASPSMSRVAGTGGFQLGGNGRVQTFDVNGDGKSDLLNASTGAWLENGGDGDWAGTRNFGDIRGISGVDFGVARFIDIDDDKRVDLITSTGEVTTVYGNEGDRFVTRTISPIGVPFGTGNVQFADMNGDGLNDPVELRTDGSVRYRLNLGRGEWSAGWRTITGLRIDPSDVARADFEDLNGDNVADVVVVGPTRIQYAINRNGARFDPFVTVSSADVQGDLPERAAGVTVLYADMNANGSEDVVWFTASGSVRYLELFPRRPNLLTRVENGIGSVQVIGYTTAAEAEAEARAAGAPWTHSLQIPMQMVSRIDRFVTLTGSDDGTGLHEVTSVTYRDGFYDGVEKQYRGFERVETVIAADEFQEESVRSLVFDVGRTAPHRNGLSLSTVVMSDGRVLNETTSTYEDCALAEVPTPAELRALGRMGVYFPCKTANEIVHKEGLTDPTLHKTVRTETTYDGYGNVALDASLGVVGVTGDELYTETEYVTPSSRWLMGLPSRERVYNAPGIADFSETLTYYDGDAYVGLPLGQATEGFVSRVTQKVDVEGTILHATRARRDTHGNSVETIDPNGTVEDTTAHRRRYTYDASGFYLVTTDLAVGEGRVLRRESRYESDFQRVAEVTKWMLVLDGVPQSNRDGNFYAYDEFGRLSAEILPGDAPETPTRSYSYELADPVSAIRVHARSAANGALDQEVVKCIDGRGREYQTRSRIDAGRFQVSGFKAFNARGAVVQEWQPWVSTSGACEFTVPSGVLSTTHRFDAERRPARDTRPGAGIYGEDLIIRTEHRPLATYVYDGEDTAGAETPSITTRDGLGRTLTVERTSMDGARLVRSGDTLFYDSTGTFAGYENDQGHRHTIGTDLVGRTVSVTNPNLGTVRYVYDDASNIVSITDGRGVDQRRAFDGVNRIVERWDAADRDGTLMTWSYDVRPEDCARTECTNLPGSLAAIDYPVALVDGTVVPTQERFGYDVRRRAVFSARRFGDLLDLPTRTAFDNVDRVVSTTAPDGTETTRTYDDMGRLMSVPGFVTDVAYSDQGRPRAMGFANGAQVETTYDDLLRLGRIRHVDGAGAAIHDLTIRRNRANQVVEVTDSAAAGLDLSAAFVLDDWYRNTEASYPEATSDNLAFDSIDRIVEINGEVQTYDGARPLAVTAMGSLGMRYDEAGQLTERNGMALSRDELGRIAEISLEGEVTGVHGYGPDDRVLQMAADGTLVFYGFDRFEVRDGVATTFVSVDGARVARQESMGLAAALYGDDNGNGMVDAGDALLAAQSGAWAGEQVLAAAAHRLLIGDAPTQAWLHGDHLGSIVAATDADGAVTGQQAFRLFGSTRARTGYLGAYGFTGQEQDRTTGLVHMKYRDLDPVTGRWDRFDPSFVALSASDLEMVGQGSTGYAYCANSAATQIDPTGLWFGRSKKPKKQKVNVRVGQAKNASSNYKARQAAAHAKQRKKLGMEAPSSSAQPAGRRRSSAVSGQPGAASGPQLQAAPARNPLPASGPAVGGQPGQAFMVDMQLVSQTAFQMSNIASIAFDMHAQQGNAPTTPISSATWAQATQVVHDYSMQRAMRTLLQANSASQVQSSPPPPPPAANDQGNQNFLNVVLSDTDVDDL